MVRLGQQDAAVSAPSHHARFQDLCDLELGDPYVFAVLAVLSHHWNTTTGVTYPSVPTIAKAVGMSERKVQSVLRKLEEHGVVESVGWRQGGKGKSVRYRLALPSITGKGAPCAPLQFRKGCTAASQRVHTRAPKGAQRAPERFNVLTAAPSDGATPDGAPRRAPVKKATEKDLIALADILRVHREPGEAKQHWLSRIETANAARLGRLNG